MAPKKATKATPKKEINSVNVIKHNVDLNKVTNEDIKSYIREVELQKERQKFLSTRLVEADSKINVLNKNISKLDSINNSLETEANKTRKSTADLTNEIANLKLQLEKAQTESKLTRAKQIKADILINAKILKDQEETIERLRAQRELIRREQEVQRNRLLEKREQIEKIRNEAVQSEFENVDAELIETIQSTLENRNDKTQIMSAALQEVSLEMARLKEIEAAANAKQEDNITLLKTQMFNLNNIGATPAMQVSQAASYAPKAVARPKLSAGDIEAEAKLTEKLNKLISDGLITENDKVRELERFRSERGTQTLDAPKQEKSKKMSKKSKLAIRIILILILFGGIAAVATLFGLEVIKF